MSEGVAGPVVGPQVLPAERNVADLVVTIVGMALAALVGLGASFAGIMLVMASDSCGASSTCDDNVIGIGVLFGVVAPWLCWIPAVVLVVVRQARRRRTWWVPLLTGIAYVPLMIVAFLIVDSGVDPIG